MTPAVVPAAVDVVAFQSVDVTRLVDETRRQCARVGGVVLGEHVTALIGVSALRHARAEATVRENRLRAHQMTAYNEKYIRFIKKRNHVLNHKRGSATILTVTGCIWLKVQQGKFEI